MVLLIILAAILAACSGFDLRQHEIQANNDNIVKMQNEGRITNGNTASEGQFPYQVGLILTINPSLTTWCGGCLIGSQWVLTAAHCTVGVKSAEVYLGATNRTKPEVSFLVSKENFIIHTGYNSKTFKNDISLIKIPSVTLSSKIQIIKLPTIFASSYSNFMGDYAIASGWGKVSDEVEFLTNSLQWARLQIISNAECRKVFNGLTSTSVCVATPGGVSSCSGDSGGPLVSESNETLIGLTSFGALAGCTKGYPAAFTRITSYLDWIYYHTGILY